MVVNDNFPLLYSMCVRETERELSSLIVSGTRLSPSRQFTHIFTLNLILQLWIEASHLLLPMVHQYSYSSLHSIKLSVHHIHRHTYTHHPADDLQLSIWAAYYWCCDKSLCFLAILLDNMNGWPWKPVSTRFSFLDTVMEKERNGGKWVKDLAYHIAIWPTAVCVWFFYCFNSRIDLILWLDVTYLYCFLRLSS